jgi:hypothetical protein
MMQHYMFIYVMGEIIPNNLIQFDLHPLLPVRLPSQRAIVIKFIPNDYSFYEVEDDLKHRYSSVYHIEEMNDTKRLRSKHIRMNIYFFFFFFF